MADEKKFSISIETIDAMHTLIDYVQNDIMVTINTNPEKISSRHAKARDAINRLHIFMYELLVAYAEFDKAEDYREILDRLIILKAEMKRLR